MQFFNQLENRNIIVSPLDWGLGHVARIIPIVNVLNIKNNVTVVCGNLAKSFIQTELPNNPIIVINDKPIVYPKHSITIFTMIKWLPTIVCNAINEHRIVKKIIKQRHIDTIISDNRYGLLFKNIECYFITHQLYPKLPKNFGILEYLIGKLHIAYLKKFTKCLIPDFKTGDSLSGQLAALRISNNDKFKRIGILSRFCNYTPKNNNKQFDLLILISGQENYRTIFENLLLNKFKNTEKKILFVRGIHNPKITFKDSKNIIFKNLLTSNELAEAITSSKTVICHSGYSTILDLIALKANAILIPTPGQTEQEYLAKWLNGKYGFKSQLL